MCLNARHTIVLNGKETIHEALIKHSLAFSDRPEFYTNTVYFNVHAKGKVSFDVFTSRKFEHFLTVWIISSRTGNKVFSYCQ